MYKGILEKDKGNYHYIMIGPMNMNRGATTSTPKRYNPSYREQPDKGTPNVEKPPCWGLRFGIKGVNMRITQQDLLFRVVGLRFCVRAVVVAAWLHLEQTPCMTLRSLRRICVAKAVQQAPHGLEAQRCYVRSKGNTLLLWLSGD